MIAAGGDFDEKGIIDYSECDISESAGCTVKNLAPDEQPRERVRNYGISSLSTADLFAIILRTGTRGYPITDLCRDLMKLNDNKIHNLERKSREEIMEINGIGELKAMQIEAVMEIVRRYSREQLAPRVQVTDAKVIYDLMCPEIGNLPHEEMWAIFMSRSNHVIGKLRVSQGSSTATVFDIKKIIKYALSSHAEAVALCHNHPSGNLRPSGPDDQITRKFAEACKTLDLRPLDHVIVTTAGYYSYCNETTLLR